jgi:hypothetical protein
LVTRKKNLNTLETEFAEYSESEQFLVQRIRPASNFRQGMMMVRVFALVRATSVSPNDQCMIVQVIF